MRELSSFRLDYGCDVRVGLWGERSAEAVVLLFCTLVAAGVVRRAALPKGKGNSATIRMSISMGPRYRFLKKRESDLRSLDKLIC